MSYKTRHVANYILLKAHKRSIPMCPMKLQKLVYLAHGWHLAIYGKSLVKESVQAWRFGPVFPSLYQNFKHYGNQPIDVLAELSTSPISEDPQTGGLIDTVMNKYGNFSAIQLSNVTHQLGTPWQKTWDGRQCRVIDNKLIEEHFISLAKST